MHERKIEHGRGREWVTEMTSKHLKILEYFVKSFTKLFEFFQMWKFPSIVLTCTILSFYFQVLDSPSKLQCHLIEHTYEGSSHFTCYLCAAVFTGSHLLQRHMLEHGLDARPYDCTDCSQKFFFRAELDNHSFVHIWENMKRFQTTNSATPKGISFINIFFIPNLWNNIFLIFVISLRRTRWMLNALVQFISVKFWKI